MKRKFLSTFLVTIVLLFSLLLSGCGETPPRLPTYVVVSFSNMENAYELEQDTYSVTFGYGHKLGSPVTDISIFSGLLTCRGYGEDCTPLTASEVLLEINDFYSYENHAEKRLKWFKTTYEPKHFVTVEIPKEHFAAEKGFVVFFFGVYITDQTGNTSLEGGTGRAAAMQYEKKNGKIYTTDLLYNEETYSIYNVFFKDFNDEQAKTQ